MALIIDLNNSAVTAQGLAPQVLSTTVQGASVDMSNGEIDTNMILEVGALTIANITQLNVQAEESADGSTNWTLIPGMVLTVTATTAPANTHQVVRGLRTQQYVRANAKTLSATTTTGAFPVSVTFVSQKRIAPASGGFDRYPGT